MHFAILGSGAVGGYYGAKLARSGQQVSFVARGAHLRAIRERGPRTRGHETIRTDLSIRASCGCPHGGSGDNGDPTPRSIAG